MTWVTDSHNVVALAASTSQKAETQALRDAARIGNFARNTAEDAKRWAATALEPGVRYVLVVGANNTPEKTAARADVKAALVHTSSLAAGKVGPILTKAWERGKLLGDAAARRQAKAHGWDKPKPAKIPTEIFDRLKDDIARILTEAPKLLSAGYMSDGKNGLVAAQNALSYRVSLAVDQAVTQSAQLALEEGVRRSGTQKMWKTKSAVPCSHCRELDGMVRDWGKPFPDHFPGLPILGVYSVDGLQRPPRHPHCACVIVVISK